MQMGRYAAKRIGGLIAAGLGSDGSGKDETFHYFDKGDMATIGRKAAVANIQWPFKGALERLASMDDMACRPHLFSYRVPQPALRLSTVGLDLPDVQRRSTSDHGFSGTAGLEG